MYRIILISLVCGILVSLFGIVFAEIIFALLLSGDEGYIVAWIMYLCIVVVVCTGIMIYFTKEKSR